MAVKKEIEIVVKSDQAVQGLNRVEDALEKVDKAAEKATEETKGLGQEVGLVPFKKTGQDHSSEPHSHQQPDYRQTQ